MGEVRKLHASHTNHLHQLYFKFKQDSNKRNRNTLNKQIKPITQTYHEWRKMLSNSAKCCFIAFQEFAAEFEIHDGFIFYFDTWAHAQSLTVRLLNQSFTFTLRFFTRVNVTMAKVGYKNIGNGIPNRRQGNLRSYSCDSGNISKRSYQFNFYFAGLAYIFTQ